MKCSVQEKDIWQARLGAFDLLADFGGTEPTSMPTDEWAPPSVLPTVGEHPRLFFKKRDIPDIVRTLHERPSIAERFRSASEEDINDGILPTATIQSNGVYNHNGRVLQAIQAKALRYQLEDDEAMGYAAVLAMKNYLKTFGFGYLNSDQCRQFGYVTYIAACVYDWCHALLSEDDKLALRIGVENKALKGTSGCEYVTPDGTLAYCDGNTVEGGPHAQGNKNKMEIGFPPSHAGALFGHNSEFQLLRDYMSFAVAIFDEDPTWWAYCGGRFYQQYYPARQYFYSEEAAIYPEGTACYGPWRFVCDMYAAWMIYTLTDELPYGEGLHRVPYSFLGHETHDKAMFATADGNTWMLRERTGEGALMVAYLYRDPVLYANAVYAGCNLSPAITLLLWSHATEEADTADRKTGFLPVQHNGDYYGQIIARRSWNDPDTPVVLMKGAGRINGGHDHNDFGSFQIYYKGFLTAEDGIYDRWGSAHHFYYHAATAAHNCLLVYNPDITPHQYYNGGQRHIMSNKPNGRAELSLWLDEAFVMGKTTGLATCFDGDRVSYVYYDNDLTTAYYPEAVRAYRRTMLTVFPSWEDVPLCMLVYDDVTAADPSYRKTFLLQCTKRPVLDAEAGRVTVVNDGGRLVVDSLLGKESMTAYGGEDGQVPERFYLSGIEQSLPSGGGLSSAGRRNNPNAWGHVELCPPTGQARDKMLHLLYVTDADCGTTLAAERVESVDAVCVRVRDCVFVMCDGDAGTVQVCAEGADTFTYYVCGLAAGVYTVRINGREHGVYTVKEDEGFLSFRGTGGCVAVTPKTEQI